MSIIKVRSTGLIVAFICGALANLFTIARVLYERPSSNGSEPTLPPPLSTQYPHLFTSIMIIQCVAAVGCTLTFAILMQKHGDPWPTYLGSSVIISSMIREVKKMAEEQISSMEPKEEAVAEFFEHASLFLQKTVFLESCSSWWKVTKSGLPLVFPGSRVAFIEAVTQFRAEDWNFRYPSGNRFRYWGNGFDPKELGGSDDTFYLGLLSQDVSAQRYHSIISENHVNAAAEGDKSQADPHVIAEVHI